MVKPLELFGIKNQKKAMKTALKELEDEEHHKKFKYESDKI